ncbi:MAG: diguanylate cyclase [Nitrospiraceae bacterium]|nr:diguanylate cyclase [Nitrospiraceae bacterium]
MITQLNPETVSGYFSLDLIPEPLVVLRTDGTIFDLNSRCAKLVGVEVKDAIGRNYADISLLKAIGKKIAASLTSRSEDFELVTLENKHFEVFLLPFEAAGKTTFIRVLLKDITNFVNLERELLKRNRELMMINTLSGAFISSDNMDLVIENILRKLLLITDFGMGMLLLRENDSFRLKTSSGLSSDLQRAVEEGVLQELCSETLRRGEPLDIIESSRLVKIEPLVRDGVVFLLVVPLASEKRTVGFLLLASRSEREKQFDFDLASLLSLLGNHISLIIDKVRVFEETRRLSITDGLTGLFNTRYLYSQLDVEIARVNRYGGSCSVVLFDIDNFKTLNDTYGHQAGDDVLHELAEIFRRVSREADIVVRYGGEEFIIILPNTYEEDAIYLADRIRRDVGQNIFLADKGGVTSVTLSGGIASYPLNASDARALLNAADRALYAAKASGKNRVLCYKGIINGKDFR